jgi:hypothetical protein
MSSTNDEQLRALIGPLFDELIIPLAAHMRTSGAPPFPLEPDASLHSYYAARPRPSMTRGDFTAPSCLDADELEQRLAAHWNALGRSELSRDAARIAAVARAAHAVFSAGRHEAELSPYVYAMF